MHLPSDPREREALGTPQDRWKFLFELLDLSYETAVHAAILALEELHICYALVGGLAATVRGRIRSTRDCDVLILAGSKYHQQVLTRAHTERLGDLSLRVATSEDLILMKLASWRPIDRADAI